MLTQKQINFTNTFANTIGAFINRDGVLLFLDHSRDGESIRNAFFIYGQDSNKHYLGEITFHPESSDFESFIDGEVIYHLKERGWL